MIFTLDISQAFPFLLSSFLPSFPFLSFVPLSDYSSPPPPLGIERKRQEKKEKTCPSRTTVVFAIVGNHEHDLPLENVASDQTAADARDVLVALHLFQLAAQEPGGC